MADGQVGLTGVLARLHVGLADRNVTEIVRAHTLYAMVIIALEIQLISKFVLKSRVMVFFFYLFPKQNHKLFLFCSLHENAFHK
jgi:hypothetical protein